MTPIGIGIVGCGDIARARHGQQAVARRMIYFAVADVDATFKKARDMNARILLPPMDFEGVGRVAMLADAQGAVFALFREAG